MTTPRRSLRIAALVYLILWACSAAIVYPGRLTREIESQRSRNVQRPTILGRSISIAPALLWVKWQEGDKASDYAGWEGIFLATPFGTKLPWKRVVWIS